LELLKEAGVAACLVGHISGGNQEQQQDAGMSLKAEQKSLPPHQRAFWDARQIDLHVLAATCRH
jgi:hypothetical protein